MTTDLEDLVGFICDGNTQVRQLAVENLVPYSLSQPVIFKANRLLPVKNLKLLVRDHKAIAQNVLTILINISSDRSILEFLASDHEFVKTLLGRITNPSEPNADLISMLLANLAKYDELKNILTVERPSPKELASNNRAIDQLIDLFVKGADGTYNKAADYDYLSYLFADLAKHPEGRKYFLTKQAYDNVVPLTKLIVFTSHNSAIRRKGVASTIKNVAFEIEEHGRLMDEEEINILPYLLLPIMGNEDYDEEDTDGMLEDLQLLSSDKKRDDDPRIIQTHIETLMLLTTTRKGRDILRRIKVYPIIRETHLWVEDEDVREACDRLVQVLIRDEEGDAVDTSLKLALQSRSRPAPSPKPFVGSSSKPFGRSSHIGGMSWDKENNEETKEKEAKEKEETGAKDDDEDSDDDKIIAV